MSEGILTGRARLELSTAWSALFQSFEQSLNGQSVSALHGLRKKLFSEFQERGLPSNKHEDWRYTNFSEVAKGDYSLASKKLPDVFEKKVVELSESVFGAKQSKLVFLNGVFAEELSSFSEKQISYSRFSDVLEDENHPQHDLVVTQLQNFDKEGGSSGYEAFNGAFLRDGVLLVVAKNSQNSNPIEIVWITDATKQQLINSSRVVVYGAENSKASIIERFCAVEGKTYFTNSHASFELADGSNIEHLRVVQEAPNAVHYGRVTANVGRDANFGSHQYAFSGKTIRNEVAPVLKGPGGHVDLFGATVLCQEEHVDNHTVLDHAVEHCTSNELYKGIYADSSRGVFGGTIIVREGAQKTNAIQNSNNILLSNTATVDAKPQLKIWADDVRCTHGATIGQLDQEQLFYLRSRGINKDDARNVLLHAFLGDVLSAIDNENIRTVLEKEIHAKLERVL